MRIGLPDFRHSNGERQQFICEVTNGVCAYSWIRAEGGAYDVTGKWVVASADPHAQQDYEGNA